MCDPGQAPEGVGVEEVQSWGSGSRQAPPDPTRAAGECVYPAGGALSSPGNQADKWFSGGGVGGQAGMG